MKIGLLQINGSFSSNSYLPYSLGCLAASALAYSKYKNSLIFDLPIFKRGEIEDIVQRLLPNDLILVSLYVWNEQISLEVCRRLKSVRSDLIVLMGGPQVPEKSEAFLRTHKFVDYVIAGEGELAFVEVLDSLLEGTVDRARSVSFVNTRGSFVSNPRLDRVRELECLPSPYTTGVFDRLLDEYPDERWTALWETNRGCPFQCTFCDWGSATASKVNKFPMERLLAELSWFVEKKIEFIYCCDANFGILQRDLDIALAVANAKKNHGYPKIFSVQSTKNSTKKSFVTQQVISTAGLAKGVSLSMQSLSPLVLESIKRDNIHQETYDQLQAEFTQAGIETYSDLIIGLPGETMSSFIDGIDYLIQGGQINRIRFNNLTVLPNAEVGNKEYQRLYGMELRRIPVVHAYGEQDHFKDDVCEYQDLVVGTNAANGEDWVGIRAYAYATDFFFFNKLLFIPLLLVSDFRKEPVSHFLKKFLFSDSGISSIDSIKNFFREKARSLQGGDVEYCFSVDYLNTYWKADEFMLISLVRSGKLEGLWDDLRSFLWSTVKQQETSTDLDIVFELAFEDAFRLTRYLYRLPGLATHRENELYLSTNLFDWYRAKITASGHSTFELKALPTRVVRKDYVPLDFESWMRHVVWYGNRTGAYLTSIADLEVERGEKLRHE